MAKADGISSTSDRLSLYDALMLAVQRFRSEELATKRLTEWMATGELPWDCESWEGLDAKSLAEMRRPEGFRNSMGHVLTSIPSAAYCSGDPAFMRAKNLKINWKDNSAHDVVSYGAKALGIFVTHSRLLALLETPETKPAGQKVKPKVWLAEVRKDRPQRSDEEMSDYADRLHPLMEANATKVWSVKTLLRRLYEAAKADRQVAQKAHKAPRTV